MGIVDFIVCYLSIGAPMAVFGYLYRTDRHRGNRALKASAHLVFWPFVATNLLIERVVMRGSRGDGKKVGLKTRALNRVEDLQRELEMLVLQSGSGISLFEVREAIERYLALSESLAGPVRPDPRLHNELFEFGNGGSVELGSLCLSRRNISRLRNHHQKARADVLTLVTACAPSYRSNQAIRTAQTLFAELGDQEGIAILRSSLEDQELGTLTATALAATN